MIVLIQRVSAASVCVEGERIAAIDRGLLLFLGIEKGDQPETADRLMQHVAHLRLFEDASGKMNLSIREVSGDALLVSQFTLAADLARGRRPSFDSAAPPHEAEPLYQIACQALRNQGILVQTGRFGARMEVHLCNDGPVTFILK